jgi:hypothetical protein
MQLQQAMDHRALDRAAAGIGKGSILKEALTTLSEGVTVALFPCSLHDV